MLKQVNNSVNINLPFISLLTSVAFELHYPSLRIFRTIIYSEIIGNPLVLKISLVSGIAYIRVPVY